MFETDYIYFCRGGLREFELKAEWEDAFHVLEKDGKRNELR